MNNKTIQEIKKMGIVKEIRDVSGLFYDEPQFHYFISETGSKNFCGGVDLTEKKRALTKAINESIERFSLSNNFHKRIIFKTYNQLTDQNVFALDPSLYSKNSGVNKVNFGWVSGYRINERLEKKRCLIPAQLVYISSCFNKSGAEPMLAPLITTGAATTNSFFHSLLNGIYEVVERDAIMCVYLNKIKVPPLKHETILFPKAKKLIALCQRYRIEPYIFDVTNDLQIPVFLAILQDKTKLGPAIVTGSKASFNVDSAIEGAIMEALMARPGLRKKILDHGSADFGISKNEITGNEKMYLFWSNPKNTRKLDFLLNNTKKERKYSKGKYSTKKALIKSLVNLREKNFFVYYVNITLPRLEKLNYVTTKAIIPGLQPLYLNQKQKFINKKRLKDVAGFFGQKKFTINSFPHPFP